MKRQIDELGRLVIPKDIRDALNIRARDYLEIVQGEGCFTVRKADETCVFCGASEQLSEYRDRFVCSACKAALCGKN